MFNVNVDNVLYGNPFKGLDIMYSDVVSKNTDESAKEYYDYYSTLPLSVILPASELIFRESRYGIKFYESIITDEFIPYWMYSEQRAKLENFINSVNDFSEEEKADYDRTLNILRAKDEACCKVMAPFSVEFSGNLFTGGSFDQDLMDGLYLHDFSNDQVTSNLQDAIDAITDTRMGFLLYAPVIIKRIPMDAYIMEKLRGYFISNCNGYGDFTNTAYSVILLRLLLEDSMYKQLINNVPNKRFRDSINYWANVDPKGLINNTLCKPDEKELIAVNNAMKASDDVIESVFNTIDVINALEAAEPLRDGRLEVQQCIYEYYAECLSVIATNGEDFKFSEETIFGENRSVVDDMEACDIYSEECADKLGKSVSNGSRFTKDDHKLIQEEVKEYFEDADSPSEEEDNDDNEDDDSSNEPENPKKKFGLKSRLTHTALDADKKAREVEAKLDDRATATKKLGKAVTAIPRHIQKNIDDSVEEVRNARIDNLQRRLLKDGYRNAWWNKIKTAIKYKMVGSVSTLLIPMYWIARKARKSNDKRLKNEVIANFNLELDILRDKYNQADKADDMELKEKLRRDIDKMERELKRVKYNARVIN